MTRTRRTKAAGGRLMWRWRRNPLRRRSDIVEAWIVLVTWLVAVLGGAFAGGVAAIAVDHALGVRRAQVHAVSAVLTENAPRAVPSATGYDDGMVWTTVRWTAANGSAHTGRAKTVPGALAGSRVTLWTDHTGDVVTKPLTASEGVLQAAMTAVLVAPAVASAAWAGGRLVRAGLTRRRLAEWDAEWQRVEPQWRHLSGGRG